MGEKEELIKLVDDLYRATDILQRKKIGREETMEKEYKKFAFTKFFNSMDGKIVLEILENIVRKDTDFENPNVNYFRDGQLSIINYIKKNAGLRGVANTKKEYSK